MKKQENRELIVKIQRQIERMPVSRYYRALQAEIGKLSLPALTELREILNHIELAATLKRGCVDLASDHGWIDGGHHKMWVIDQMVRALLSATDYTRFRRENPHWGEGIAP